MTGYLRGGIGVGGFVSVGGRFLGTGGLLLGNIEEAVAVGLLVEMMHELAPA